MKVLMIFADGFEDVEAIATRDVLVRAGIEVIDSRINNDDEVVSSHHMHLNNFIPLNKVSLVGVDAVIIPGGSRGVNNLLKSDLVDHIIKTAYLADKYVCAICAGPMVLAKNGLLKERRFTCYPGCEDGLDGIYTGEEVVVDHKIITARSMYYSVLFGLTIIEALLGKTVRDKIYKQIAGIKEDCLLH